MIQAVHARRVSGVRKGQAGDKWLAKFHSWAARPCGQVKAHDILSWSEQYRVRSGNSAHRHRHSS